MSETNKILESCIDCGESVEAADLTAGLCGLCFEEFNCLDLEEQMEKALDISFGV